MFIKQLYHYNKYWLAVFLCFILFFFYINYKWGVVATPVYQYGMFSGNYSLKDTITIYKLYVDGIEQNPANMHFTKKDMLFTMAEKYEHYTSNPILVYQTMQGVFAKIGLGSLVAAGKYQQPVSDKIFADWLLHYSRINGKKLQLMKQSYLWKDHSLQPLSSPQPFISETY